MNKRLPHVHGWIEWSSEGVALWPAGGGAPHRAPSMEGLRGLVTGPCVVLMSRRHVFIKPARLPNAKASELSQVVAVQAAQLFPTASGPLAHDVHLTSDVTTDGRLAILAAVPVSTLGRIYEEAASIGVSVLGVVPIAFGSEKVARMQGLERAAIVESTPEGVAVDLVVDGHVQYVRVAPPTETSPVDVHVARALAASGQSPMPTLVTGGDGSGTPSIATPVEALVEGGASGLPVLIELPEAVEGRARKAVRARARLAMLMVAGCIAVAALVWDGRDQAATEAAKQEAAFRSGTRKLEALRNAAVTENNRLSAIAIDIRRAMDTKQTASDVVTVAGNLAPKDVWLTGVSYERGKELQLRGTAMTNDAVKAYLQALGEHPRFRDVRLVFANNALIESTTVVQFSMSAHVIGNLPAVQGKKERARR